MSIESTAENCLSKMSVEEKIGQCLTYWWRGAMITPSVVETITRLHCGGLRVEPYRTESGVEGYYGLDLKVKNFERPQGYYKITESHFQASLPNYNITASEYARRLNRLKEIAMNRPSGAPLHICTDFEGDFSHDFAFDGMNLYPPAMGLKATGSAQTAYDVGYAIGKQLADIGINMLHSPVCDVNLNPKNPEINIRAFADSPGQVSTYAAQLTRGIVDARVIATAKHFPGRGDSAVDAHKELPVLDVTRERLDAIELYPYKAQIEAGVPAIMTAHNVYPALDDSGLPATLSHKILIDILRNEMGFKGLITSDAMGMGAIVNKWGVPVASAMAINAGCDLILLKFEDELRSQTFFEIKRWVDDGRISMETLDARVRNVLTMKAEFGMFENGGRVNVDQASATLKDPKFINLAKDVAEKSVMIMRDRKSILPLSTGKKVLIVEQLLQDKTVPRNSYYHQHSFNEAMLDQSLNVINADTSFSATDEEIDIILNAAHQADAVVMTNYFWRVRKENNTKLFAQIKATGKPVVVVTNNPFEMGAGPEVDTAICTFSVTPQSLKAAAAVIYGKLTPTAQWPLDTIELKK
ncbi:MAG: hypothetical protein GF398_06660 [Chitinivibrionales bacterium]|nr:hypothetical protein [Chitinivibrionales bacterium]